MHTTFSIKSRTKTHGHGKYCPGFLKYKWVKQIHLTDLPKFKKLTSLLTLKNVHCFFYHISFLQSVCYFNGISATNPSARMISTYIILYFWRCKRHTAGRHTSENHYLADLCPRGTRDVQAHGIPVSMPAVFEVIIIKFRPVSRKSHRFHFSHSARGPRRCFIRSSGYDYHNKSVGITQLPPAFGPV